VTVGFTISGSFLPNVLARKGAAHNISTHDTYLHYVIIYCCGVPGVLLGAALIEVPVIGRKWGMFISSAFMAISLFLFTRIDTVAANVGFSAMEYFFQSMFNAILYGYTPELFDSAVRGTAFGMASTLGRLTSIVAPIIVDNSGFLNRDGSLDGIFYLAGGGVLLATVTILGLPETKHRQTL